MKYSVVEGDIFAYPVIAHGCNTVGVAGGQTLAGLIFRKYPEVGAVYASACQAKEFEVGDAIPVEAEDGVLVYNLGTQQNPGADATHFNIMLSLYVMMADMKRRGIKEAAIPALGCGVGGLDWEDYLRTLNHLEEHSDQFDVSLVVVVRPQDGFRVPADRALAAS